MTLSTILPFFIYLVILVAIVWKTTEKKTTSTSYILGNRNLNFWLTAFAAHASDMSAWIFLGYPVLIYTVGLRAVWLAAGLVFFMWINWNFIAPKLRFETEKYNALTFSTYFETKLHDTTGNFRIFTAIVLIFFYTVYISASICGIGVVLDNMFESLSYNAGCIAGAIIVVPFLYFGGYTTLAYIDSFQAIFLFITLWFIPFLALSTFNISLNSFSSIAGDKLMLISENSFSGVLLACASFLSWGLGYFGQPHILTKFMGSQDVKTLSKSKRVGLCWQILILVAATFFGVLSLIIFKQPPADTQLIFPLITKSVLPHSMATFILCSIIGATITHADSQILVVASTFSEDIYRRICKKNADTITLLKVTRIAIIGSTFLSLIIALYSGQTIFSLVEYAWFGLGSSFGPVLIGCLFFKRISLHGAYAGLFTGTFVAFVWPFMNSSIPTLIPGFTSGILALIFVSLLHKKKY